MFNKEINKLLFFIYLIFRYQQVITLVPTDPYLLAKIGDMFDSEGDKQQAFQYHSDVCKILHFVKI